MSNINQVIVEGNVVRNAEFRQTQHGTRVCTFPIAVNRRYKDRNGKDVEEVSFFDIEAWEKLCQSAEEFCEKGRGLRVVGRLKQNRWKNQEGKTSSRVLIVAEHLEFKPRRTKFGETESAINEAEEKANLHEAMETLATEKESGEDVANF